MTATPKPTNSRGQDPGSSIELTPVPNGLPSLRSRLQRSRSPSSPAEKRATAGATSDPPPAAQKRDYRHRGLLRPRRERPRCRTANQRDERKVPEGEIR